MKHKVKSIIFNNDLLPCRMLLRFHLVCQFFVPNHQVSLLSLAAVLLFHAVQKYKILYMIIPKTHAEVAVFLNQHILVLNLLVNSQYLGQVKIHGL